MNEPKITINGVDLTEAQAMTMRVALSNFGAAMAQPYALGADDHGKAMARLYTERSGEILAMMVRK